MVQKASTCVLFLILNLIIYNSFGQKKKGQSKTDFGIQFGIGLNKMRIGYSNWQQGNVNYFDSLKSIKSQNSVSAEMGFCYTAKFNEYFSLRANIMMSLGEGGNLVYDKGQSTETLKLQSTTFGISLPLLVNLSTKTIKPYVCTGVTFLYRYSQLQDVESKYKLKDFDVLGQIGFGIKIPAEHVIISPEIIYNNGFINVANKMNNLYTNTIDKLNRQKFCLTVFFTNKFTH